MNNILAIGTYLLKHPVNYKSQWYTECEQIDKNDTISSHVKIYLHM